MKGKCIFLAGLLAVSGVLIGIIGVVLKYAVLEPMGIQRQESAVAMPFVYLRDAGLRYMVGNPQQTAPSEPVPVEPAETETELGKPRRLLFIGDSRTCGLRDHARVENADYFCDVGMNVFNATLKTLSDTDFKDEKLYDLLSEREYGYVIISLGLNEAGYPLTSLLGAYGGLLDRVVQTQPQAVIVVHGVMAVSRGWAEQMAYTTPEYLTGVNAGLAELAQRYRVMYLNADEEFADAQGFLPAYMTADGCHLYPKYLRLWSQWILEKVDYIGE